MPALALLLAVAAAAPGQLAVARPGAGIALTTLDGARVTALTHRSGDEDPAFSPDGARIAFSRAYGTTTHVVVMRGSGGGLRVLTRGRFDGEPAWSPDGRRIAYAAGDGIRVLPAGGGASRVVPGTRSASGPAWVPGTARIAYARGGRIWTARTDGSGRRAVVAGRDPAPSPDGTRIAYTRWPASGGFSVHVRPAAGGAGRLVLGDARAPAWRPAGSPGGQTGLL